MATTSPIRPLAPITLPPDYEQVFDYRTLFVTGVGRSGTTIVGKLFGSMRPAFYLFEPLILRLFPYLTRPVNSAHPELERLFKALLFEDYLLPQVHGRNLNFNSSDDSYALNYYSTDELQEKWRGLSRRRDAFDAVAQSRPLFILKMPELQPLLPELGRLFRGMRSLVLVRNGNDAVASAIKRGWYTDEQLQNSFLEWVAPRTGDNSCHVPWYLDSESAERFSHWSPTTRAACVWRSLTALGHNLCQQEPKQCVEVRYEDFASAPADYVRGWESNFGIAATPITERHLASIASFTPTAYSDVTSSIEEPERTKFCDLMNQLGYGGAD